MHSTRGALPARRFNLSHVLYYQIALQCSAYNREAV